MLTPEWAISYSGVPLAISYLKSYASIQPWYSKTKIDIHEDLNTSMVSDAFLVNRLTKEKPDMIGFSLYPWNLVRSLYIAEKIKEILPKVKIIVGGPEVSLDNELITKCNAVDTMVLGEGEEAFSEVLESFINGKDRLEISMEFAIE